MIKILYTELIILLTLHNISHTDSVMLKKNTKKKAEELLREM